MKSWYILIFFSFTTGFAYPNFSYIDGNGNKFEVNEKKLFYSPISQDISSSGFYEGGEPKLILLNPIQKEKIKKAFQIASTASKKEIQSRKEKGTGVLIFQTQNKEEKVLIFKPNSTSKENLEKTLLECLGK